MKNFDLSSPDFNTIRYEIYKELRAEEPVYWYSNMNSWLITRYDDIMKLLKSDLVTTNHLVNDKLINIQDPDPLIIDITNVLKSWMIYNEAPAHTKFRKFMNHVFVHENIQKVRPLIKDLVRKRMAECDLMNGFDFVNSVANPISAEILRILLGLEEIELDKFFAWSDSIATFMQDFVVSPTPNIQIAQGAANSLLEMKLAFLEAIERRKLSPKLDLLSGLVEGLNNPTSGITEDEVVYQLIHLIFGGHKVPQYLLGNSLHCILTNPDAYNLLINNKEEYIPLLIEEVMRFEAPIQFITRHAKEDIFIHGKKIKKGDSVYLMLGSANRDETVFKNPEIFNLEKRNRRHISFGGGIHACLAAGLVTEEIKEIFSQFFNGVKEIRPLYDLNNPVWSKNSTFHGIEQQYISIN
ncbi:cytochrome P450 [Mucilaginibacter paludis]|uniref:Cytochrome P450 n=1 Tax=Mucilaginibacter paludis DSM 18603 TaxID=714943 RepID=H1YIJ5_9SPHI|nr:cytochrome P450 [Mucilaginibacter paludis]EHQ26561.1 cytochrome P450 [Mucilaginibacter paludis DSM 18603]